jgi:hypothetical protein
MAPLNASPGLADNCEVVTRTQPFLQVIDKEASLDVCTRGASFRRAVCCLDAAPMMKLLMMVPLRRRESVLCYSIA